MEFKFPKLPNIITPIEGEEVPEEDKERPEGPSKPQTQAAKNFSLPKIEQSRPGNDRPWPSTAAAESVTPLPLAPPPMIPTEEVLGSGRLRLPPEMQLRGNDPASAKAAPLSTEPALDPIKEVERDIHEIEAKLVADKDEAELLAKTDEFPIESEPANIIENAVVDAEPLETKPASTIEHTPPAETTNIVGVIASTTSKIYSIGIGQSLEQVAQEMGVDVYDLLRANPDLLKDPLIFAGQRIKIPHQPAQTDLQPRTIESATLFESAPGEHQLRAPGTAKPSLEPESVKATVAEPGQSTRTVLSSQPVEDIAVQARRETRSAPSFEQSAVENKRQAVKQVEEAIPGFGLHGNREREDKAVENRGRRQSDHPIPEPFDEWADYIYRAASDYKLEPALIASVIWHESGGKNIIGKDGHGHGLMQIDDRRHSEWLAAHDNGLDPASNIEFGASLLRKNIDHFRGKSAAGIAAYNCGIDAVEEALVLGKPVDYFTTNSNYSISVLTQQEYFKRFF